ncbi:diacylglycerol acyltransferase [Ochromonadaceae sp. CCMP2298]|nr:diacylglycerol acyltransferase [Ochromonadaceae sp. CCMP2298]
MPPQGPPAGAADAKACYTVTLDKSKVKRGIMNYVAVFLWIGWTNFYFNFTLAIPLLYMYNKTLLSVLTGAILLSAFSSIDRKKQPKWCWRLGEYVMRRSAEYFHVRMIVEDREALEKAGPVLFAMEPHHVLPLSIFAFNDCLKGFEGQRCLGCLTGAAFKVPLMRHMYTWCNSISVDKRSITKYMGQGYSPVLCPGGVQEVILMKNEDECVLYLKSRLGFIKLALTHGRPIVPVFAFGLQNSFFFFVPRGKFMAGVARKLGFLPMAFFGVFGTPLGPARPCDYTNYIGSPIPVPKIEHPSEADLRKYQALYVAALSKIFEDHKEQFGMGRFTLRVA